MPKILDVCCGSRMFWFNRNDPNTTYMDIRSGSFEFADRGQTRTVNIQPDVIGDFRAIPFDDATFDLVVFDPPHLIHAGENSWLARKYGKLDETWPFDIRQSFVECMRVLRPNGFINFKWNEDQIKLSEILDAAGYQPLFGDKRGKTHWLVFAKE